jgi:hypothetical protein
MHDRHAALAGSGLERRNGAGIRVLGIEKELFCQACSAAAHIHDHHTVTDVFYHAESYEMNK